MSKNILEALGKIDVALGGNANDAVNVIDALDQISEGAGSLKTSVDSINGVQMRICGTGEYDAETGIPTVENPVEGVFYLTPAGQQDNNVFNEYYYKDGQWEMFGGASINVNDLFDLSDRMAKGVDDNGDVVEGAVIEGVLSGSYKNKASGSNSHAEGYGTTASGNNSHAEGVGTTTSGDSSHAEGVGTTTSGDNSHAEGYMTTASSYYSHAEGNKTTASGNGSHSEGFNTIASGNGSHAEGFNTKASGIYSHTEGRTSDGFSKTVNNVTYTQAGAYGQYSHSEGSDTLAINASSHAEGQSTTASGYNSHTEGNYTTASGNYSHAEGYNTTANHQSQHVFGEYNIEDPSANVGTRGNYVEIVGNGAYNKKSNARTLDWSGNETLSGSLTLAGSLTIGKGTADEITITAAQLKSLIALLKNNN